MAMKNKGSIAAFIEALVLPSKGAGQQSAEAIAHAN